MAANYPNNLQAQIAANQVSKAFGIKITSNGQVVTFARNAGFDSLFIDMEHGWLSHEQVSNLCQFGLMSGVTPFVRVPHQCGNGFVQRVLDGGAMGIIFPHIHSAADAEAAVRICKFPPQGCRSMTGLLPHFGLRNIGAAKTMAIANQSTSTVFAMIETGDAVERAAEIAAVDGVDVVLVGSVDLSIAIGVPGQLDHPKYRDALVTVSRACKQHGKVLGIAGATDHYELQDWAINELGVRYILAQMDTTLLASGAERTAKAIPQVKSR